MDRAGSLGAVRQPHRVSPLSLGATTRWAVPIAMVGATAAMAWLLNSPAEHDALRTVRGFANYEGFHLVLHGAIFAVAVAFLTAGAGLGPALTGVALVVLVGTAAIEAAQILSAGVAPSIRLLREATFDLGVNALGGISGLILVTALRYWRGRLANGKVSPPRAGG